VPIEETAAAMAE
jgi:aryl-alcohol dehydrogenase-like predicted oxidoreductase